MAIISNQNRKLHSFFLIFLFFIELLFAHPIEAKETVDLYLKWYHQFQFAGYYTALEKGYYQEVGLDVNIHQSTKGLEGLHQVVSEKEARYGVGTNEVLLQWHVGKPIVVIAVIFQHSPAVLITKRTHPNQSIHDLKGKRLMLTPHVYELLAYLKKEKLELTDFKEIPHSFRSIDLIEGRADVIDGYSTTQTYEFQKSKIPVMIYSPRTSGIDFYGDNLFTSQIEIRNHPNRVKRFREASLRGWMYAMKHKAEIVDLIYQKYSENVTNEQLLYEAEQMEPLIQPNLVEMGYMYEGRWKHISEVYADFGMLPKNLNLNGFLYNPNPNPNYGWIVSVFVSALGFLLVAWLIQRYRWNKQYSENLKSEVFKRTEELKEINDTLGSTNQILELKLKELKEAEGKLLTSEKLATVGNVTAGMAHEMNTPLGAIVSSNGSIKDFFLNQLESIINQLLQVPQEDKKRFFALIHEYSQTHIVLLNGKKERDLKKELKIKLKTILPNNETQVDDAFLDLLLESYAYGFGETFHGILQSQNHKEILQWGSKIANVYRSNSIITIAAEKSAHVVKTLKNYLLTDDVSLTEESVIDIRNGIETILALYDYNMNTRVKLIKQFHSTRKCKGSRDHLNLVWVNLLNNALYAISYEGTIEIQIKDDGPWIVVSFIDEGIGISEEIQNRIFEPFFTTKSGGEGLGLGLDICRKIISKMGGQIRFESRKGYTRFDIFLLANDESFTDAN